MRIAVLDTYYPPFLRAHYDERPALHSAAYAVQHDELMRRAFGTSDAYSHNLRLLGHDAIELVVNCVPLQAAWLEESGRSAFAGVLRRLPRGDRAGRLVGRVSGLLHRVALEQVRAFAPDVVYLQDIRFHTPKQIRELRGPRLVVGQTASRTPSREHILALDLVLTSFPHYVDRFRALGGRAELFRLGFDERVLALLKPRAGCAPVVFVGGLDRRVHPGGVELVEQVCRELGDLVDVYGYGVGSLPGDSAIHARYRGEAWGREMYDVLAGARIVLNRHIGAAEGFANNMRLYETTGVGTALLTECAPNLADLFEPGVEVAVYGGRSDAPSLLQELLADGPRLRALAEAGQRRTLGEHTFAARMGELVDVLERFHA